MIKYKGYYIDKVVFNGKQDIDNHIKNMTIEKYKQLNQMFSKHPSMELVNMMQPYSERLHNEFGLSWEEIEALEAEAITA